MHPIKITGENLIKFISQRANYYTMKATISLAGKNGKSV